MGPKVLKWPIKVLMVRFDLTSLTDGVTKLFLLYNKTKTFLSCSSQTVLKLYYIVYANF